MILISCSLVLAGWYQEDGTLVVETNAFVELRLVSEKPSEAAGASRKVSSAAKQDARGARQGHGPGLAELPAARGAGARPVVDPEEAARVAAAGVLALRNSQQRFCPQAAAMCG